MKSLSNVIKYWGAKEEAEDKVINSNLKADLLFSELTKVRKLAEGLSYENAQNRAESEVFKEWEGKQTSGKPDFARLEQDAMIYAEEILREAGEKGEEILKQASEAAKRKEEEVYAAAVEKGYTEGYEKAILEIAEKEKVLEEKDRERQKKFEEEVHALVPKFTDLVIKYVEKLTGIFADEYESIIYNVMSMAINGAEPSKSYIIYVPKEQYKYVLSKEDYISDVVGEYATFEIVSDSGLSVNSCRIETEGFVIDTGLDTRLLTLVNSLKLLADVNK